jgi:hypothetical protein
MVKIYEVAYSEHTVHHKRFEAGEAIAMASKEWRNILWDLASSGKLQAASDLTRLPSYSI